MASTGNVSISFNKNSSLVSEEKRISVLKNPGFGKIFTDHMLTIRYSPNQGWHDAKIQAYGPISLNPAACVFHYGQEIFEGLKAYKGKNDRILLFRPEANAKRFVNSAKRLAMEPLPEALFLQAIYEFVNVEQNWIPDPSIGSLYLRPLMIANTSYLGVKPSSDYLFVLIACPVGSYFSNTTQSVTVWISEFYTRAASGGTGEAKCGGNYAASLIAQQEASKNNCDQIVFLDAAEHKWIEEMGGMNIFFVFDDGTLLTPPLSGTILPGITRDSILTLAKDKGLIIRQERYAAHEWIKDIQSEKIKEVFACGTAAVITPIGKVKTKQGEYKINQGGMGPITKNLLQELLNIQHGVKENSYNWIKEI